MRPPEPVVNRQGHFSWLGLGSALLGIWLAGCQASPTLGAGDAVLVDLIARRLELGRDVAWSKFNRGAAIVDAPREKAVLASIVSQAARAGIDSRPATTFFNAQILASRQLQEEVIDGWRRGLPRPDAPPANLVTDIRPRLDAIGEKMIAALAAAGRPSPSRVAAIEKALGAKGFSAAVARLAAAGLATPDAERRDKE
jgi:chorismate mutase-like protein